MGPRGGTVLLVLAVCASGCATLGWRLFPNTRTYHYQREVVVDVQSSPEGATVYEDGKLIGTAPFRHRSHHDVKRVRRSRSGTGLVLGCVASTAIAGTVFREWVQEGSRGEGPFDYSGSTKQDLLLLGWLLPALDCYFLGMMVGIEQLMFDGSNGSEVSEEPLWRHDRLTERIVPRALTLEARWADWSPVKSTITVPDRSLVNLRRGHAGTFDDALVRRARTGAPLSHDGLLRAGRTYHQMASETRDPAHTRAAISYYEQYLQGSAGARRAEIEAWIAELRRVSP